MERIRVLVVEPNEHPKLVEIEHTLEQLQKLVGGNIAATYPYSQKPRIAQILYSLRVRFHRFCGETAFKLRLAFDPKFRDAVESFKRNARVKVIKITADENGEPTVSIVDRVPATPKERGESEGNLSEDD